MTRSNGFDRILEALGNRCRRRLLFALQQENPLNCSETRMVVDGGTVAIEDRDQRARWEVDMYHRHLPKLDDIGYVEWDRPAGTIAKGPKWGDIEPLLELLDEHEDELRVDFR